MWGAQHGLGVDQACRTTPTIVSLHNMRMLDMVQKAHGCFSWPRRQLWQQQHPLALQSCREGSSATTQAPLQTESRLLEAVVQCCRLSSTTGAAGVHAAGDMALAEAAMASNCSHPAVRVYSGIQSSYPVGDSKRKLRTVCRSEVACIPLLASALTRHPAPV